MNDKAKILVEEARRLPANERVAIAEELLASLDGEADSKVEKAWVDEVRARIAAYERGEFELIDAEDVFAELRRR